jgi:hypothetical protein
MGSWAHAAACVTAMSKTEASVLPREIVEAMEATIRDERAVMLEQVQVHATRN